MQADLNLCWANMSDGMCSDVAVLYLLFPFQAKLLKQRFYYVSRLYYALLRQKFPPIKMETVSNVLK